MLACHFISRLYLKCKPTFHHFFRLKKVARCCPVLNIDLDINGNQHFASFFAYEKCLKHCIFLRKISPKQCCCLKCILFAATQLSTELSCRRHKCKCTVGTRAGVRPSRELQEIVTLEEGRKCKACTVSTLQRSYSLEDHDSLASGSMITLD